MAAVVVLSARWDCVSQTYSGSGGLGIGDGVFGLGWPKLAFEGTTVPIMNMLAKDVLTAPEFAFYFTRDENTKLAELSFGGVYGVPCRTG